MDSSHIGCLARHNYSNRQIVAWRPNKIFFKNSDDKKGFNLSKRLLDIALSIFFLCSFGWVFIVLYLVVRTKLGSPVFFIQKRAGLNGKVFDLIKFRTMAADKNDVGEPLSDAQRTNALGHFLRNTSLDELPEIWNVIKGDMSIVGPRPLLVDYLPLYNQVQARRHCTRPGITGWAQVNGRNALSWEERFNLDIWYVENQSFLLDIQIILLTLKTVFLKKNINSSEGTTMKPFRGSHER